LDGRKEPRALELQINELVLHGFNRAEGRRVTVAFRNELTRLVTERGLDPFEGPRRFPGMADQLIARLSTCDRRVWGSVGPWGFRGSVSAPGRSPTRPPMTFGAFERASRARRLFTCARAPTVRTGDFEDLATVAVDAKFPSRNRARGLPAASPVRLLHSARPFPASLPLLGLSKDRLSIGPPCRSPLPASIVPALRRGVSWPSKRGLPPRSRATRLRSDLTVSTVSPVCSSCKLPGLHPAPILGFAAFPSASALASASFPAARFRPSKLCSPPNAANLAHARSAAARHPTSLPT